MAWNMQSILRYGLQTLEKDAFCFCCVGCFINVSSVLLVGGGKFCVLADFLPGCSSTCRERASNSPTIIADLSSSPFCYISFCFVILQRCCLVHAHLGLLCLLGGRTPTPL